MELDKRIKEGKKPLNCVDIEIAKEFIGKKGYFANWISAFKDLETTEYQLVYATLKEVDGKREIAFTDDFDGEARYFLPDEWVEEEKKTYRPYTVMEFIKYYPIGSHLHFRPKNDTMEMHRLIDGYNDCKNGAGSLFICGAMYSMLELYDNYEIFKDGEWQPFGVLEE